MKVDLTKKTNLPAFLIKSKGIVVKPNRDIPPQILRSIIFRRSIRNRNLIFGNKPMKVKFQKILIVPTITTRL